MNILLFQLKKSVVVKEEITQYSFMHTEITLFMLAVTVLSWLTIDLEKKTENGHCHNPAH